VLAYRLYKIDADDDRALIEARNYVDGRAIEVWRDSASGVDRQTSEAASC
jgi:hypothetical protein